MDVAWFKARKKALKTSDEKIADFIGRDRSVVNRTLAGKVRLKPELAAGLAEALQTTRAEILYRAGITEESPAQDEAPQIIMMGVQMPSAAALTDMMRSLLEHAGQTEIADELAPRLARRLPGALAEALAREPLPSSPFDERGDDASPPPPAKARRERAQLPSN